MSDIDALARRLRDLAPAADSGRRPACAQAMREAADALEAMQAETKRHQKANLVRAVTNPLWEEREGWIAGYIAREDFDAIPWRVAKDLVGCGHERAEARAEVARLQSRCEELERLRVGDVEDPLPLPVQLLLHARGGAADVLATERSLADRLAEALLAEIDGWEDDEIGAMTHEALASWRALRGTDEGPAATPRPCPLCGGPWPCDTHDSDDIHDNVMHQAYLDGDY